MRLAELAGAPVLVAGAGVSGLAAAAALVELGARVTVADANPAALADLPDGRGRRRGGGAAGRDAPGRDRSGLAARTTRWSPPRRRPASR